MQLIISVAIAIQTIYVINRIIRFNPTQSVFSFLPLLVMYLSGISFFLSIYKQLTTNNFLLTQYLLLMVLFIALWISSPLHNHTQYNSQSKPQAFLAGKRRNIFFILIFFLITGVIIFSYLLRRHVPTSLFDEIAYRASAPLYWIQHKSIFRFTSVIQHKNVFIYQSGIVYMWPILMHAGENVANVFFWSLYPATIILIFLLSRRFTTKLSIQILPPLLYAIAPIIFKNYSTSLSQELLLAPMLLSATYFLLESLNNKAISQRIFILLGIIFGLLPQIKPTASAYLILGLPLYTIPTGRSKIFLYLSIGMLSSFILTGYIFILVQNTRLYGTPGGTTEFIQDHTASVSMYQLITHLKRIPFTFLKIPCYSSTCTSGIDSFMQLLSSKSGATNILRDEDTIPPTIGIFTYTSNDLDRNFGFGGIALCVILLLSCVDLTRTIIKKTPLSKIQLLQLSFTATFLVQILFTRWQDLRGVPYRHVIALFALGCVFSTRIFQRIKAKLPLVIQYILIGCILLTTAKLFSKSINSIHELINPDTSNTMGIIHPEPPLYLDFLSKITAPSCILLIEPFGIPDYPFFWFNNQPINRVYLSADLSNLSETEAYSYLNKTIKSMQIDYVVAGGFSSIIDKLLLYNPQYTKILIEFESNPIYVIYTNNNKET